MNDVKTLYRCTECSREVLNRRVAKCLFCGAALPETMLLAAAAVPAAALAASMTTMGATTQVSANTQLEKPAMDIGGTLDIAELIFDTAPAVIEMGGSLISAVGDLLGGLA